MALLPVRKLLPSLFSLPQLFVFVVSLRLSSGRDPEFGGPVSNVTVIKGRDAVLGCRVDDLRGFKVAWVKVDTQTILTIHHHVISRNARLALEHDDLVGRKWDLRISDAQEEDRGWYLCQVNTSPMMSQKGYLQVVVPPEILDEGSTGGDVIEKEGEDVLFRCQAKGYPHPYITWRREDEKPFKLADALVTVMNGPELRLKKINRLHMGAYLCIASNGVPPSQSKRFNLKVQFPPMLWVPSQLEGAYVGQASVVLRCHTEAFPESINYWLDEFDQMIRPGEKYDMTTNRTGSHVTMTLTVKDITLRDLKGYQCIAKNSLGQTVGSIRLEEVERPIQEAETESIVPPPQGQNHQGQNHQGRKDPDDGDGSADGDDGDDGDDESAEVESDRDGGLIKTVLISTRRRKQGWNPISGAAERKGANWGNSLALLLLLGLASSQPAG